MVVVRVVYSKHKIVYGQIFSVLTEELIYCETYQQGLLSYNVQIETL